MMSPSPHAPTFVPMVGSAPFSGNAQAAYFCDAGCRPNPGTHLLIVWDGTQFLPIDPSEGTNHRAAYQAVLRALHEAADVGASTVEIRLTSDLVFRQLRCRR